MIDVFERLSGRKLLPMTYQREACCWIGEVGRTYATVNDKRDPNFLESADAWRQR